MKKFHQLKVQKIARDTDESVILGFEIPTELRKDFSFMQGQYLTLMAKINGEEVRRSYSLCSSPLDAVLEVAIKQVPDGKFSTFANQELKEGDFLDVMPPDGKFYVPVNENKASTYVAFAAGSGITPICSIIKTHLEQEPASKFKLFYVNKTASSIMLKEQLEALKNLHMQRLEIYYFLTREHRNIPLLNGRLDEEKLGTIFKGICPVDSVDHFFMCGPEAMINTIREVLQKQAVPKEKTHFELFGSNNAATAKKKVDLAASFKGKTCELRITEGGKSLSLLVEQGAESVLDSALKNAADLPFACKGGVCATCRARIVEGEVDMLLSYGLEQEEIDNGYILTCQSFPISDKLIVDFDV